MPPERTYVSIGNLDRRMYRTSQRRFGMMIPGTAVIGISLGGLLDGTTALGVVTNANDADGRAKNFLSAGGGANQCGLDGAIYAITQTRWNARLWMRFKLNQIVTQRFWAGLFSASPLGADSLVAGAIQSVGLRASTTAAIANFVAYSSSAVAENISNFPVAVPADAAVHDLIITIKNAGAGVTIQLDNQAVSFLANLPAIAQDMGFCLAIQEQAIVAKNMRIYYAEIETDR
ncbi:MAG: hypothetical protein V1701_02935 [Planctomycetota bacterium]